MTQNELEKLYRIFKNSEHGSWICGFDDFQKLHDLLGEIKPKRILELGTGIGAMTAILAAAAPEATINTVEQFDKCVQIAKELIPAELQERITFHQETPGIFRVAPIKHQVFQRYEKLPEGEFDFVVIDGPGPFLDMDEYLVDLPGGDFMQAIKQTKPGAHFYIDGRKVMAGLMVRFFSGYLKVISDNSNNTLLKRINEVDDSLKVADFKLHHMLEETDYFHA